MGQVELKGDALEVPKTDDATLLRAAAVFLRQHPSLGKALLERLEAPLDFEELTQTCAGETDKAGGIAVVYQTPWPRPHLHCRAGMNEAWTKAPGLAMRASPLSEFPRTSGGGGGWFALRFPGATSLEFLTNDGGSQWDKAPGGGNYIVHGVGLWILKEGRLSRFSGADAPAKVSTEAVSAPVSVTALGMADKKTVTGSLTEQFSEEGVTILYRSTWPAPHLHCRRDETASWTQMPGLVLDPAGLELTRNLEATGQDGQLFAAHLPTCTTLEFVMNDGGPHYRWDKAAGGSNFRVATAGVWLVAGGRLEMVLPPPAPLGRPTVLDTTPTSVSLAWPVAPRAIRSYRVYRNDIHVASLAAGTSQFTDSGLLASHSFTYTVAAVSPQGAEGPMSETAVAQTGAPGKPGAPKGLRVTSANDKGVTLEWGCPEDTGGLLVTTYVIARNGEEIKTLVAEDSKPGSVISWMDSDVVEGAVYSYTVRACHLPPDAELRKQVLQERREHLEPKEHELLSSIAEEVNVGVQAGPLEVEAMDEGMTGLCQQDLREQLKSRGITVYYKSGWQQVFAMCSTGAERGWTQPPGLELAASPTLSYPAEEGWKVLYLPCAKSLEFVLTDGSKAWDKAPGDQNYKVAIGGVLMLTRGQMDRVAPPPQTPTALAASALDGSRVELTWRAPAVADDEARLSGFRIFRNGRLISFCEGAGCCCFTDKNLFAFTAYEYSVAAVNHQGVAGPLSTVATVDTELPGPPSAPQNLRANIRKEAGSLCVHLEWEPPEDCGGAPVASYEILRDGHFIHSVEVPSARLRSEAEACQPMDPEAEMETRWVRSSCSYSNLSWFLDALEWTDEAVTVGQTYSYEVRAVQLGPDRAEELRSGGVEQRCGSRFLDNVLADVVGPPCAPAEVRATAMLDIPKLGEQRCVIMFQAFDWGSCKADSWYTVLLGLLPELRTAGVNMMWLPPPSDSVDKHGYLPRKWYILDNHYGSAAALQRLVSAMHEQEIWPMLDVVVNHRCASRRDSAGRWLSFQNPDWEGWAICHNSPAVPGGTGAHTTGEPAQYAPSVDHSNKKVREDVDAYIRYMFDEVGFRALRFDFVKGYAPHFQRDYVRRAGSPFAVAENWNGDPNGLHHYVQECQGCMAVYDFPLYYTLKRCVHSNNFQDLNENGRVCGIAGRDPARSCTFIDNHDTYQLAIVGGAFGNNDQVLRAYAFILTHCGVPCVFHHDYVRAPYVREKILQLCSIRRDAGIHSTSQVQICASGWGIYAAIIGNRVAFKMGTNDWSPGGGWKFAMSGSEFAVWIRG